MASKDKGQIEERLNTKVKVYLMPKPECAGHLDKLEDIINQSYYVIKEIYKVNDWESVARQIYSDQLKHADKSFVNGFEAHVWALKQMYGNRSLILTLDRDSKEGSPDLASKLKDAINIKKYFRDSMLGCEDGTFLVTLNAEKIPGLRIDGFKGVLGTASNGVYSPFDEKYAGRWDYVFFKYVHCPDFDPKLSALTKEWDILNNSGVISPQNLLSRDDWMKMKYLKTMIPLSEYQK